MGATQEAFAAIGGVGRRSQTNYEANDRAPDSDYLSRLAEAGVDVAYVITGQRSAPATLTAQEPRASCGASRDATWLTVLEVTIDEMNSRGLRLSGKKLVELVDLLADYAIAADGTVDKSLVERQIRLVA